MSVHRRSIFVAAVAVIVLAGSISPAAAAPPPWTVSAASAPPPTTVTFQAQTVGPSPQIVLTDVSTGNAITCSGGRISGGGVTGTYATGANLIHVTGSSFSAAGCGGIGVPFTASGTGTWPFNAANYVTTAGGTSTGRLTSMDITWSASSCTFTVTGDLRARYINGGAGGPYLRMLAPTSNLTAGAVSGCFGAFNNGDLMTLVAKYRLLPGPNYPIQIT